MKKLYTTLALVCGIVATVSAQKVIDLETTLVSPAPGSTITVGQQFPFQVVFKNKGTGAIAATDTLFFAFSGSSSTYYLTGKTKAANDTIYLNTMLTFNSAPNGAFNLCVVGLELNGTTITDSDTSNNRDCNAITITGGTNGIADLTFSDKAQTQKLNMYPNPATGKVTLDYTAINESEVTAHVFDVAGREVMNQSFGKAYRGKTGYTMDVSALTTGMYYVELRQEGVRSIGKINKQ